MFGRGSSSSSGGGYGSTPALQSLNSFTAALDSAGIKYSTNTEREKPTVSCVYDGDNFKDLSFIFIFDTDGESVAVRVWSIEKFTQDQLIDAMVFCNKMNNKKRWINFYVDDDMEFTAQMDAVIDVGNCGARCVEILQRAVRIVDDVCKELNS